MLIFNKRKTNRNFCSWLVIVAMLLVMLPPVKASAVEPILVTGVTVTPESANIIIGATQQLAVKVAPSDATNKAVTWSSNAPLIATVDTAGVVTGVAAGTATITATTPDGIFMDTSVVTIVEVPITGTITGKVTDPDGVGLHNALILVMHWGGHGFISVETDANGNYTIPGLAPRRVDLHVFSPQGVRLAPAHISGIEVTAGATTIRNVALVEGGLISGKVTGPDKVGVPNALISARPRAGGTSVGVTTDVNGNYTTRGLAPGIYDLDVHLRQGVLLAQPSISAGIEVTAGATTIRDVTLVAGGLISGRVTGPDGAGVPNASISVWNQTTRAGWAQTNANGYYTTTGLAPGTYELEVFPPWGVNLLPTRISGIVVTAGATITRDVVLVAGGIITGRVTDTAGAGVHNASISLRLQATTGARIWGQTDANGNYTVSGLAPGTYELEVRPPQGVNLLLTRISGIEVTSGVTTRRDVALVAGGLISGKVTGPDGVGMPNAWIFVRLQATTGAGVWVQTDANGNYTASALALGTYELEVRPPQGVNLLLTRISGIEVTSGVTTTRDVALVAGGLISGQVIDPDGFGVPNAFVSALDQSTGAWVGSAQTDAEGRYAIVGLASGTYDIGVRSSPGDNLVPIRISGILVTAGQEVALPIELFPHGAISGKVTDGVYGVSAATVEVAWKDIYGDWLYGRAVTRMDGGFTLPDIPPGTYDLRVIPLSGVNLAPAHIPGIVVAAGQTTTVDASLNRTITIDPVPNPTPTPDPTPAPAPAPTPGPAPTPTPPTVVEQPIVVGQATEVTLEDVVTVTVTAGAITGAAPKVAAQIMPAAAAAAYIAEATGVGLTAASDVVVLTMTGGVFTAPVQLTLNFDAAKVAAGQVPSVFVYNERTGRWIFLGGQVGDGTITVTVDRFSKFAVFATTPLPALADIADHWGRGSIRALSGIGIINGFPDGTFKPGAGVTRAEFVSMLSRALGLTAKPEAAARFTDATDWARGAIGAAAQAGLVAGYADGTFGGSRLITRAEMAVILQRVIRKNLMPVNFVAGVDFADAATLPAWAADGIRTANTAGLVRGFQDRTFRPGSTTTRAEAAAMLYRLVAER